MRVLLVADRASAPADKLAKELPRLGWSIQRVTAPAGSTIRLVSDTAAAVSSFKPTIGLLIGDVPGAARVLRVFRIPYVCTGVTITPAEAGGEGARGSDSRRAMLRRARAVMVSRWANARAIADAYGSVRVVHVASGLNLARHPIGPREEALAALRLPPRQRLLGLITAVDGRSQVELLSKGYRLEPGVGLVVSGEEASSRQVEALQMTARPSAPVIVVGPRAPATDLLTACAATVGLDLDRAGPGESAGHFLVQGRRVVTVAGEDATPLLDLYPAERRALHVARPTEDGITDALRAALVAEAELGPIPSDDVDHARYQLDRETWPQRVADVVDACA